MYVCIIVGVLLMVVWGPWNQSLFLLKSGNLGGIVVAMIPFYIGIVLVILGILNVRKLKRESR